jgi:flagellar protein FliS
MFGGFGNRAAAYAKVGVETGVNTADPHKLILMLFDGALLQVRTAGIAIGSKDIPAKGTAISKAVEIIINGLKVSLDLSAGGELAQRLAALYDYMSDRLLYANLHNSQPALDEVAGLLATLREAWAEIRSQVQPAAV